MASMRRQGRGRGSKDPSFLSRGWGGVGGECRGGSGLLSFALLLLLLFSLFSSSRRRLEQITTTFPSFPLISFALFLLSSLESELSRLLE